MRYLQTLIFLILFLQTKANLIITSVVNPQCAAICDGQVGLNYSIGQVPYSIIAVSSCGNAGPYSTTANSYTLQTLCACSSTYTIYVSDALNTVIGSATVTITSAHAISILMNHVSPSCSSCSDGTLCGSASGGTGTYNYSWQPAGTNSPCLTNIPAGSYTLCVTDVMGCYGCDTVTLVAASGIKENVSRTFDIFPNPVSNILFFKNTEGILPEQIEIYDVTGRKIRSFFKPKDSISTEDIPNGMYEVKIISAENIFRKKILISR